MRVTLEHSPYLEIIMIMVVATRNAHRRRRRRRCTYKATKNMILLWFFFFFRQRPLEFEFQIGNVIKASQPHQFDTKACDFDHVCSFEQFKRFVRVFIMRHRKDCEKIMHDFFFSLRGWAHWTDVVLAFVKCSPDNNNEFIGNWISPACVHYALK